MRHRMFASFFPLLIATATSPLALADTYDNGDTGARIEWIQSRLDGATSEARRWQYGWSAFYGVSALAYGASASGLDEPDRKHDRFDARVNATTSALGLAGLWLDPLVTDSGANQLADMPKNTADEQQTSLQKAESLLRQSAEQEAKARSTQAHILTTVVSVLAGVAVAGNDHRHDDGWLMAAESLLVGELQIHTAPTAATEAWQAYQRGDWNHASQTTGTAGTSLYGLSFSVHPNAVGIDYRF